MIVKKINTEKHYEHCNFCNKGELDTSVKTIKLKYPYEYVYRFQCDGSGIIVFICKDCLNELNKLVADSDKYL